MTTAKVRILWPLLLLALMQSLAAETVHDLYEVEVPAADRGQRALDAAAREAMGQVLVKVSGNAAVLRLPEVENALAQARGYVQRYSYLDALPEQEGVGLRFQFEGATITELLKSAGAPVWTANRPAVLIWLAVAGEQGPHFVNRDSEPELVALLQRAFSRRGVPMQLPLFDLADASALPVDDVWELSLPPIVAASLRYDRENVLAGRLSFDAEGLAEGEWSYLQEDQMITRPVSGVAEQEAVVAGVDLVADAMAARYAVAPTGGDGGGILIQVAGIRRYGDYAAVVRWLQSLELVEQVNLVHIQADRIELRLVAQLDSSQLAGLIDLNKRFVPAPAVAGGDDLLSYRWQN